MLLLREPERRRKQQREGVVRINNNINYELRTGDVLQEMLHRYWLIE